MWGHLFFYALLVRLEETKHSAFVQQLGIGTNNDTINERSIFPFQSVLRSAVVPPLYSRYTSTVATLSALDTVGGAHAVV